MYNLKNVRGYYDFSFLNCFRFLFNIWIYHIILVVFFTEDVCTLTFDWFESDQVPTATIKRKPVSL